MIDFNPGHIYQLAEALTTIEGLCGGSVLISTIAYPMHEARNDLEHFVHHQQHTIFPETIDKVKDVLTWIGVILPYGQQVPNRPLADSELSGLIAAVSTAAETFEAECGRVFVVGLEKQRALYPKTLIEEIASAFSSQCWKRLSNATKKEIEECGKCLAFDRYTAAGFHMLRALESEVLSYIARLPVSTPQKRDLGHYIGILRDNGADPKLVAILDNIRSLDRNPLMHPEDWLEQDDAIGIFNTTQTAFERLIADLEKRKLLPPA